LPHELPDAEYKMRSVRFGLGLVVAVSLAALPSWAQTKVGSAFAIANGKLLITNHHVIDGCADVTIADVGPAIVLKSDSTADVAVLKLSKPLDKGLAFRGGHQVRLGEEVIVIGYPLRGVLASPPTVTTGIVSSLAGIRDDHTRMQISAPVQPGNSGGPVLDRSGHVVGVVVSKLNAIRAAEITGDIPQNVNFAVQASIVTSILDSYSLDYGSAASDKEKSVADIVAESLPAVLEVQCSTGGSASPQVANAPEVPKAAEPPTNRTSMLCGRQVDYSGDRVSASGPYGRFVESGPEYGALVVQKSNRMVVLNSSTYTAPLDPVRCCGGRGNGWLA
jgi:Trypsin-like peptidase domain